MSADAWETCPFCHIEKAVREDYDIWLNENGLVCIAFTAVCRECGIKWEMRKDINCVVKNDQS